MSSRPDGQRLLERDEELRRLASAARSADRRSGSVIVITGEAGVGKTSVVRALNSWVPAGTRVLTGFCDPLTTPRALGPLKDVAPSLGRQFSAAVEAGDRERVMSGLVSALGAGPTTVLVVEDLHWADEGTLDVLRHLARRIDGLPAVLVVTYRDDEAHPAAVRGLVAPGTTSATLLLPRLSSEAVGLLVADRNLDPAEVFRVTTGNPYLVGEVLAGGTTDAPESVVGAVAERLQRLPRGTRTLVEQLAVVPGTVDTRLASRLVADAWLELEPAEGAGLLTVRDGTVAFRHELTRLAVLGTVAGARQVVLHRTVLDALLDGGSTDPGRIVHHAVASGDVGTILVAGPQAAREAAASGSHREAAAHLRTVLKHEDVIETQECAQLWEDLGHELYAAGDPSGVTAAERAVALRRQGTEVSCLVRGLCLLSRLAWIGGHAAQAVEAADEAVEHAGGSGRADLEALALGIRAQIAMLHGEHEIAIGIGRRAADRARECENQRLLAHAITTVGTSLMGLDQGGETEIREGIDLGLAVGDVESVNRGHTNLSWSLVRRFRIAEAEAVATAGLAYAIQVEHRTFEIHLTAILARIALENCAWERALELVRLVPEDAHASRGVSLVTEGLVRARSGDGDPFTTLVEAWEAAQSADELQRRGPVAVAFLEASFLAGRPAPINRALAVHREAQRLDDRHLESELGYRFAVLGHNVPAERLTELAEQGLPFALQAVGRWHEAAEAWQRLDRDYERAVALSESDDPARMLEALELLHDLGALGPAQRLRRRLRESGETSVPSGPSARTRANSHGLTDRQVAVMELVADGLTNAEIAERLALSRRTVDSHVSAILAKLGVATRRHAVAAFKK